MTDRVLIDTGPLVTFLSRNDAWHDACVAQFDQAKRLFLTCWPVLTEVAWLLGHRLPAVQALLRLCDEGVLELEPLDSRAPAWIAGSWAATVTSNPISRTPPWPTWPSVRTSRPCSHWTA